MTRIQELVDLASHYEKQLPPFNHTIDLEARTAASYVDHSFLKPDVTPEIIEQVCRQAVEHGFAAVSINPLYLPQIVGLLSGSPVAAGTVVSFPLGALPTAIKLAEVHLYAEQGAQELDTVMHVGFLKSGRYQAVLDDLCAVVDACHTAGIVIKVIHENCLLSRFEKILACLLSIEASADFVKTSSGFSTGGATVEDVELMRRVVGPTDRMGVKAATGIKTLADAERLLLSGANRLGTSAGVRIWQEVLERSKA